jgi:hypothetical protein
LLNWLAFGLLFALPLWSGQREPALSVAVYSQFQYPPSATVLQAMQDEVENIMAPLGARFEWRSLDQVSGSEVSSQLAVVKFLGHCDQAGYAPPPTRNALGWTHVSDGVILPFSDVDCDGIRHFLQTGLLGLPGRDREEVYGRAVGRVLAHEFYHIFANTVHHGSNGVGKSIYSVFDLLSRDFQFREPESEALHNNRPPAVAAGP